MVNYKEYRKIKNWEDKKKHLEKTILIFTYTYITIFNFLYYNLVFF